MVDNGGRRTMKKKTFAFLALLLAAMALCSAGPAVQSEPSQQDKGAVLEKRVAAYISQFFAGNFTTFYGDAAEKLTQSISKAQLQQGWVMLQQQITGSAGNILSSQYVKQGQYDSVVTSIAGTLFDFRITISFDSEEKPAGILISPIPKEVSEPQSTAAWEEAAVKVGEKGLPGLLTLPKGIKKPPVVLLVQGSGSSDMNESIGKVPVQPFKDIARGLAEQGVASLRYNKRTYQYPWATAGITVEYEVLDDAEAAVDLLYADDRVDGNAIYLLGHSLGGMLAPKIAQDNPHVKGIISMAGSLRSLQDIMLDQNKAMINAQPSYSAQQKKALLDQAAAGLEKTKTLDDGGSGYIMGTPTSYWKSLDDIHGMDIIKKVHLPMLILQGNEDFQVPFDKDYKLWQVVLMGRDNVTFRLYDGLSHLFMPGQISPTGTPDVSLYNTPQHVDPMVITDIATWVKTTEK
jgi:dienelactone hydrolase